MTGAELGRLGRTVMHLRPEQLAHRARLRGVAEHGGRLLDHLEVDVKA